MTIRSDSLRVHGYCPGCGQDSLYANMDGTLECIDELCPSPSAAMDILSYPNSHYHMVDVKDETFNVQHPLIERIDGALFDCMVHDKIKDSPRQSPGTYWVYEDREGALVWLEAPKKALRRPEFPRLAPDSQPAMKAAAKPADGPSQEDRAHLAYVLGVVASRISLPFEHKHVQILESNPNTGELTFRSAITKHTYALKIIVER